MDLANYPPSDLAIECDVTSRTTLQVYQVLEVPEICIYREGQLNIYLLASTGTDESSSSSSIFPNLDLANSTPALVEKIY